MDPVEYLLGVIFKKSILQMLLDSWVELGFCFLMYAGFLLLKQVLFIYLVLYITFLEPKVPQSVKCKRAI